MTDKQKLIDILMDTLPAENPWEGHVRDLVDHLIANGVTFATDKNDGHKWIPVTERMPEHGDVCLIHSQFGDVCVRQWDSVVKWWIGDAQGYDFRADRVTHWMPLPDPPKEVAK